MAQASRSGKEKGPLRRLSLGILIAFGLALVLVQTAPQIQAAFVPVRTAAGDQISANSGPGLWARLTGQSTRNSRIEDLERQVRELSRWKAAALSMVERMETYETILNLQGEPPARGVTARIAAESDGPFSETLLANAGRNQGVEPGFVAVNEAGLVGRVIELGERSSRILMVTDFNSRTPIMGEASGVRAILYGGREGFAALDDLPEAGDFALDERILTSGEGGVYPRGLLVGTARQTNRGWRVRLAMKDGQSGFVRLLPSLSIPEPGLEVNEFPADPDGEPDALADSGSGARLAGQ